MEIAVSRSKISGQVEIPGSKSHTIRAVAAALAAGGESIVHAPLISADTISTLNAAERLGAKVVRGEDCWRITGTGGDFNVIDDKLDMGEIFRRKVSAYHLRTIARRKGVYRGAKFTVPHSSAFRFANGGRG